MRGLLIGCVVVLLSLGGGQARAQEDQPPIGDQPTPMPTPAPTPAPAPEPAPTPISAPPMTATPVVPDREEPPRPPAPANQAPPSNQAEDPVVRAAEGNMGMYFRFGGLATLVAEGNTRSIGPLAFSQIGLKFVLSEKWMVPLYFSTGIRLDSPDYDPDPNDDQSPDTTNWGLEVGSGFEYHFRVWRRISPFLGVNVGLGFEDPTGETNLKIGVGMGPILGVEYYIADRVSLTAMYMVVIQIGYQEQPDMPGPSGPTSNDLTTFVFSTMAGGALNLTYYF